MPFSIQSRTILVVDDNEHNCKLVEALLEEDGFEVVAAHDGQAAIERFVIHDLKNMLASLISNAEFLSRRLADAPILEDAAEDILAVGHEMDGLTQDLLRIGQGEEGSLVVNASSVDLEFTINEVCQRFDRTAAAQSDGGDVSVAADVEAGLTAEVDEDLVVRMLDNLLDNALRYAPAGTTVEVHAWQTDADIRIEVSDQGPGIAPEFRDDVFKKYYRVDNDKKGTGVGLAFCRVVAVEHGGAIWVDENDAGGCVVCVQLPATQSQELRA